MDTKPTPPSSETIAPKAFISYSWTTPEYEARVLEIAKRLRNDGVDVILDKWDLKEGHDAHAFMERAVTDRSISKVVILSDAEYARKADDRERGVGTETQIISREVYGSVTQDKFIPVVMERTGGAACLPTFLGTRIYVDFSSQQAYLENYEQLLRTVFGKPLHVKPALGTRPAYLDHDVRLGEHLQPLVEELDSQLTRGNTVGARRILERFLERILDAVDELPPAEVPQGRFVDELVRERLPFFLPYRDNYIDALMTWASVSADESHYDLLHDFLEQLFQRYPRRPQSAKAKDGVIVVTLELLLCTVAVLLKRQRFAATDFLLRTPYLVVQDTRNEPVNPWEFAFYPPGLQEDAQQRTGGSTKRVSIMADIIKERATHRRIGFSELAQAELVLYIRASAAGRSWFPRLLIFRDDYGVMEVFARARSSAVLSRLLPVLGMESKTDLIERLKAAGTRRDWSHRDGFWDLPASIETWLNTQQLGTVP